MGKRLSQVVNSGLAGEPENIVFQILDTLKIFELDDITHVNENGINRSPNMPHDMHHVLNHMGHRCYIEETETGENILFLD